MPPLLSRGHRLLEGRLHPPLPPEQYEPRIRTIKSVGVDALMLTGYVTVEPAAFDVDEETKRLGGFLDSLGMCAAQHHGLCATWAPAGESQDEVVERMVRCARWTANLNSKVLVIHPGNSIARLRALGYDGYANFESGPWELPDLADGYRHAIDYWRACERIAADA